MVKILRLRADYSSNNPNCPQVINFTLLVLDFEYLVLGGFFIQSKTVFSAEHEKTNGKVKKLIN